MTAFSLRRLMGTMFGTKARVYSEAPRKEEQAFGRLKRALRKETKHSLKEGTRDFGRRTRTSCFGRSSQS